MPMISYPTAAEIPGPWIIDARSLSELDSLFDAIEAKACEDLKRAAEIEADEMIVERSASREHNTTRKLKAEVEREDIIREILQRRDCARSVTVDLSDARTAAARTFSDLEALATAASENPRGFRAFVRVGDLRAEVSLQRTYSSVSLAVSAHPSGNDTAQEAFGRLQNWAVEKKPPRWQQLWLSAKTFAGMGLFLWIVLWLLIFASVVGDAPKRDLKAEARQSLSTGINPSNANRAIELLLAIESDYVSPAQERAQLPSRRSLAYFVAGVLILISLRFCPTLVIGLWQGRQSVVRWRAWLRTVAVSIPGIILTTIIVPWLLHWSRLSP